MRELCETCSLLFFLVISWEVLGTLKWRHLLNQVVFNVLKNPNPLKDDEASALLDAAVLVLALFWGSSML